MKQQRNGKHPKVRVAAIGDLHMRETGSGVYRELLDDISQKADILVLCGDLTDHGLPREAEVLAEDLAACRVPMIAVLGNHDYESGQHEEVRRIMCSRGVLMLDGDSVDVLGIGFAGVKGFAGGFDNRMLQPWGESMIKDFVYEAVNEAMRLEGGLAKLPNRHKVVVMHYSPIRATVENEPPEVIPFLGSSRLVEPIDNFGASVVFHGHSHFGSPHGKTARGVPVHNVSLPVMRRLNPEQPYGLVEFEVEPAEDTSPLGHPVHVVEAVKR